MKLKYLVFGASCFMLCASTVWARPTILDGAVIGHWKIDGDTFDERKADSSGYGGCLNAESTYSSTSVRTQSSGGFSGGCLNIGVKEGKAYATLGSGQTLATYHTFATWVKPDSTMETLPTSGLSILGFDENVKQFALNFNDFTKWHMMIEIYQNQRISSVAYSDFCDPANLNASPRPEAGDKSSSGYPMSVSGSIVTIGGRLKNNSSYKYIGLIDEVQIINRMLSKTEVTRLYLARESYIYPVGDVSFSASTGWSNADGVKDASLCVPGAADYKAAAYIVDQKKTLTGPDAGGVFGQSTDNKVSLTLGRLTPLMNLVANTTIVAEANKHGNFRHGATANTTTTFYDLRLNDGTITPQANGQMLTTTLLDVDAPSTKPFGVSVGQNLTYTFNAGGKVTGSGVLAKTGAGTLVLNDFVADDRSSLGYTDNPKVRLAEGAIKTPRLDGYTGGTVIVDGDAVRDDSGSVQRDDCRGGGDLSRAERADADERFAGGDHGRDSGEVRGRAEA